MIEPNWKLCLSWSEEVCVCVCVRPLSAAPLPSHTHTPTSRKLLIHFASRAVALEHFSAWALRKQFWMICTHYKTTGPFSLCQAPMQSFGGQKKRINHFLFFLIFAVFLFLWRKKQVCSVLIRAMRNDLLKRLRKGLIQCFSQTQGLLDHTPLDVLTCKGVFICLFIFCEWTEFCF